MVELVGRIGGVGADEDAAGSDDGLDEDWIVELMRSESEQAQG